MFDEYYNIINVIFRGKDPNAIQAGMELAQKFWLITLSIIGLIILISLIKIFQKAGEKPWKVFIPIYNLIVLYRISGISPYFLLVFLTFFIPGIKGIAFILFNIVEATQEVCLCRKFNKSLLFIICMIFFNFICYPILAFGKSKYKGQEEW